MPSPTPTLTRYDAQRLAAAAGFDRADRDAVGVEMEWLPCRLDDPARSRDPKLVRTTAERAALPHASRLTFEPGGQVELSTLPVSSVEDACRALADDAVALIAALADENVGLLAIGFDPRPLPERCVHQPRYAAMEAYFDRDGSHGRTMMCGTAALQVNLKLGDADTVERRWRLAHEIGPTLAAACANSPLRDGAPSGWKSTRLSAWSNLDRARTRPVTEANAPGGRNAWARFALDAPVMFVRESDEYFTPMESKMSFETWVVEGHELGYPTADDLKYHLTTLFPPVRPRGWLEIRGFDVLPDPWWRVPVVVTAAVLDDPTFEIGELPDDPWTVAARDGLGNDALAEGARRCFALAHDLLRDTDSSMVDVVDAYAERYVATRRSPADDVLDAWKVDGTLLPAPETFA